MNHFLRSIATVWKPDYHRPDKPFRVIDIGCGRGDLMLALHKNLPILFPHYQIEVYGLEVTEHRGAEANYFHDLIQKLEREAPDQPWKNRLKICSDQSPWPFEDEFFDCIVSSQVLEHVNNHELFFAEHYRVLQSCGIGIHRFPLQEIWRDGHLHIPFVHWLKDYTQIKRWVRFLSKFKIGKWSGVYRQEKLLKGFDLDDYVNYQSEYIWFQTNYISMAETLKLAKKSRHKASFILSLSNFKGFPGHAGRVISKLVRKVCRQKTDNRFAYSLSSLEQWSFLLPWWIKRYNATLTLEKQRLKRYGVWC